MLSLFFERLLARALRSRLRNLSSKNRISQLGFKKIVERIQIEFSTNEIRYIPSDQLLEMLDQGITEFPKIVVSGSSDANPSKKHYLAMKNLNNTTFFVQNLNFPESNNIFLLPIGVEDFQWARNGMPWNFNSRRTGQAKLPRILVGPFAPTNEERVRCMTASLGSSVCAVVQSRMPNWSYSLLASRYQFVACPSGNGFDTHRFWETIYRASVPVVVSSHWSNNLKHYGLDLFELSQWNDLSQIEMPRHQLEKKDTSYLSPLWWRFRFLKHLDQSEK
jgi:hypothetical protein